jgi:hypothetical protein
VKITEVAARALISEIHAADHSLDVERFLALLTPTVRLQLGSQPELHGHSAVRAAISGLFQKLAGIDHQLKELWLSERTMAFQAAVTYTLPDRRAVQLPYVDVLRLADEHRVEDYRIYIDLSPLMVALATTGGTPT